MKKFNQLFIAIIALIIASCNNNGTNNVSGTADAIYFGGDIVTMEGDSATYAEAIAVKDGKIVFVGSKDSVEKFHSHSTAMNDLQGKTMLPGFIDTWGHIGQVASLADFADLSFWGEKVPADFDEIITQLKQNQQQHNIKPGEWVVGKFYDQTYLKENKHPTRFDLDKAFPDNPVMLLHLSGLMGVANSAALKVLGISDKSTDPPGGTIVRKPGTMEPTGLLQGAAYFAALPYVLGKPDIAKLVDNLAIAETIYLSNGFTTIQDGGTSPESMQLFKTAAEEGKLQADIIALPAATMLDTILRNKKDFAAGVYENHLKIGGIVMPSDGGPQERTALFSKSYLKKDFKKSAEYGNPLSKQEQINQVVKLCYANNLQYVGYGNGDSGIAMHLNAIRLARMELADTSTNRRSVITHSQFVRSDQLDIYREYGIIPCFFTDHAYMFGDVHIKNLGKERAFFLSPMKTASGKGLMYNNHNDYPSAPPSALFTVWTAVNRISRTNVVIGPGERVSSYAALKAITVNAAYMYFEENTKGSIKAGKLADFVILDQNPVKIDPMKIKDIKVMETIKEGKSIYKK